MGPSVPMKTAIGEMSWGKACQRLLLGDRVRRLEWPEEKTYFVINEEKLVMYMPEDKLLHLVTVSTGDMMGEDWIVIPKTRLAIVPENTEK